MADYVLVHGGSVSAETWNSLSNSHEYPDGLRIRGECWKHNVAGLKKHGHQVFAPDLSDENTHKLSDHIEQICSLIQIENLNNIILVGHSYGGMVITGVASRMPERIRRLVYLDADYPESGQSLFDILAMAGYNPREVVDGAPPAYTEKLFYDPERLSSLSKVYISCTRSEFSSATDIMTRRIDFNSKDWSHFELPTVHLAQATMPNELNEILMSLSELDD